MKLTYDQFNILVHLMDTLFNEEADSLRFLGTFGVDTLEELYTFRDALKQNGYDEFPELFNPDTPYDGDDE